MSEPASATTRSYRQGDWFGVFGERATVLLPPDGKARVSALWELADTDAGFDELLDALLASGLRSLTAFALVSNGEEPTRVLVRGELAVRLLLADGAEVEVGGREAATWVERTVSGVASLQITAGDGPAEDLPIGTGLVRVSRVDQPPAPAPQVPVEPPVEPAVELPAAPPVGLPFAEQATEVIPQAAPPAPSPPAPPTPPVFDPLDADHDGHTVSGSWDLQRFTPQQPGIPGQPPAPLVTAMPVARLVFSHGDAVDVDRAVLVGRAPEARRFSPAEQPRLVTVPSPNQEISSTHLEVRPGSGADHGSAVVTDMGSTNGTVLNLPGLPSEELQAGIAVQLVPGAVIDLGDGVTIHVTTP